jgi:hypothetical protein
MIWVQLVGMTFYYLVIPALHQRCKRVVRVVRVVFETSGG